MANDYWFGQKPKKEEVKEMGTPVTPAVTTAAASPSAPKVSWLSKVGSFLGKVLGVAQKVEPTAAVVAEALLPQFAPEIALGEGIFNKAVKEVIIAETASSAAGAAKSGPEKLNAVLAQVGPALDTWVVNNFPGQKQVSTAVKSGLINAVVAILNELQPPTV
jgi:hypothetical protein